MGTISDKLNWLYTQKSVLVNIINGRFAAKSENSPYAATTDFSTVTKYFQKHFTHRMRLVPVLSMYTQYNYISSTTYGYVGKTHYTDTVRTQPWLNNILDRFSMFVYNDQSVPVLTRLDTGVVTASSIVSIPNAVINLPFVIGCGSTGNETNQSTWMGGSPLYAAITHYYGDTANGLKIVLSDDSSNNDGHFILGNISLVDPLTASYGLYSSAMLCICYNYFNTGYLQPDANVAGDYIQSSSLYKIYTTFTQLGVGHYTVVYSGIGTINFSNYCIIPINTISGNSGTNNNGKNYISLKNVTVNYNSVYVELTTSDDDSLNNAPFCLMVFAKKYNT